MAFLVRERQVARFLRDQKAGRRQLVEHPFQAVLLMHPHHVAQQDLRCNLHGHVAIAVHRPESASRNCGACECRPIHDTSTDAFLADVLLGWASPERGNKNASAFWSMVSAILLSAPLLPMT